MAYCGHKNWKQWSSQAQQDAQVSEHRAFFAEVERAWERSHPERVERRHRERVKEFDQGPWDYRDNQKSVPARVQEQIDIEASKKKKRKGKKNEEDIVVVDDELEAEMVEDVEDFLLHSRLRDKIKGAAEDVRERQRRQEEKQRHLDERKRKAEEEKDQPKLPEVKGLPPPSGRSGAPIQGLPSPAVAKNATSSKNVPQTQKTGSKAEGSKQAGKGHKNSSEQGAGSSRSKDTPKPTADAPDRSRKEPADGNSREKGSGNQNSSKNASRRDAENGQGVAEGDEAGSRSTKGGRGKGSRGRGGAHEFVESNPQEAASDTWWSSAAWGSSGSDAWWDSWQSHDAWWGDDLGWGSAGGWRYPKGGGTRTRGKGASKGSSRGRGGGSDADVDNATVEEDGGVDGKSRGSGRGGKGKKQNSEEATLGEEGSPGGDESAEVAETRRSRGRGRQGGRWKTTGGSAGDIQTGGGGNDGIRSGV
eukprot:CAMPEP_0169250334 /NCGR_PEP_ID=MMETSP1016-20121227/36893_1 /TAXON_ID=342587 /ORGANISM="Karlodinium micrum, Strain CCMP2283" /LENGTH=474 /DNA_ID=CAMNT_0009331335 /DNA_START=162 /DNA_END=1583 /DNA_ORIENTATION=+